MSRAVRTSSCALRYAGVALLLGWLALAPACQRTPLRHLPTGKVVRVIDGDTIEVLVGREQVRVRLHGVDSPERGQPYGNVAREFTGRLALGSTVGLDTRDRDRYGRTVAEVVLADGRVLNRELVGAGLAWWYEQYAPGDDVLKRLEAGARSARQGLWAGDSPVPPWEWRRRGQPARK